MSHTFFKKPVASPYVILKKSAVAGKVKMTTLFQEAIRRLQHVSPDCPWDESARHLSEFSNAMRISGYNSRERLRTIQGAVSRHREMLRQVEEGKIVSINRSKVEISERKLEKGGITAGSWFLKGETKRVITCQPTPGGKLARTLTKVLNPPGTQERTLVTEDGGKPAIMSLRRTDPFMKEECRFGDETCMVEKGKDCGKMGVIYEVTCNACREPIDPQSQVKESRKPGGQPRPNYVGMTRTSAHCRMQGHLSGQRTKSKSNPLHRHDVEGHQGIPQQYSCRILASEQKQLPLNILEALYIEKQVAGSTLNDKNEYGRGEIIKLRAVRGEG